MRVRNKIVYPVLLVLFVAVTAVLAVTTCVFYNALGTARTTKAELQAKAYRLSRENSAFRETTAELEAKADRLSRENSAFRETTAELKAKTDRLSQENSALEKMTSQLKAATDFQGLENSALRERVEQLQAKSDQELTRQPPSEFPKPSDEVREQINQLTVARDRVISENRKLKQWIGHPADEDIRQVEAEFKRDMLVFSAAVPESQQNYRAVPEYLVTELRDRYGEVVEAKSRVAELEAATEKIRTEEKARFDKLQREFLDAKNQFDGRRTDLRSQLTDAMQAGISEQPEGRIVSINVRERVVWIDLGREDGLKKGVKFRVFPRGTIDVAASTSKGSVEVTRLLDAHLAEARILDDLKVDSILVGDVAHSTTWSKAGRLRVALVGLMDIDGDGKSDRTTVRNLILANNGVIDADIDESGKQTGSMTINTRYVVMGERPAGATATAEAVQVYSGAQKKAYDLGIEKISLQKLLDMLGYQHAER